MKQGRSSGRRKVAEGEFDHYVPRPKKAAKGGISLLTEAQVRYDDAIFSNSLVFGIGPAGTGKTWLAAARAADELHAKRIKRLFVTRPAVDAGESLGFLPGELDEKVEPWFRPVRDALEERLGASFVEYLIKIGVIEIRPLGLLRGATFKDCWVLGDEMQNTTPKQMKMFLTRIGENCKAIVNGDPRQIDIPGPSGLMDAVDRLAGLPDVATVRFVREDIVRSGLCRAITGRYEAEDDPAAGLRRTLNV